MEITKYLITNGVHKENNSRPFEYYINGYNFNGYNFKCERCDFGSEIIVEGDFDYKLNKYFLNSYTNAVASMIFHHSYFILPHLDGFKGYDCLTFRFVNDNQD